jgi:general secretion pathway protein G
MVNSMKQKTGFTLLELMVVLIILSLLAMLALPRFFGRVDEAKVTTTRVQIQNLETALRLFYLDNGFYPTTEQGLKALVEKPGDVKNWREGGYLEKGAVPKDSWGNDFIYHAPGDAGREYEISSLGRDGKEGGTGVDADIKSWETPQ